MTEQESESTVAERLDTAGAILTLHIAPDGVSKTDYRGTPAEAVAMLRSVADSLAEAHGVES